MKIIITEDQEQASYLYGFVKKGDFESIAEYLQKNLPFLQNEDDYKPDINRPSLHIDFFYNETVNDKIIILGNEKFSFNTFKLKSTVSFHGHITKPIFLIKFINEFYGTPKINKSQPDMMKVMRKLPNNKFNYEGIYPNQSLDEIFSNIKKQFFNMNVFLTGEQKINL